MRVADYLLLCSQFLVLAYVSQVGKQAATGTEYWVWMFVSVVSVIGGGYSLYKAHKSA